MKYYKKLIGGMLFGLALLAFSYYSSPGRTYSTKDLGNGMVQDIRTDQKGWLKVYYTKTSAVGAPRNIGQYIPQTQLDNEPASAISTQWNYVNLLIIWAAGSVLGFIILIFSLQRTSLYRQQNADFDYMQSAIGALKKGRK